MSKKIVTMRNPWGSEVQVTEDRIEELEGRNFTLVKTGSEATTPEAVADFTKKEILTCSKELLGVDYRDKTPKGKLVDQVLEELKSQEKSEADFVTWCIEHRNI